VKTIVTTTINPPTEAIIKFIGKKDWKLIVVGDLKTPHHEYENIQEIIYLHPDDQHSRWKTLSEIVGFNCIQRRNFGFIYAYEIGAEVVATVDDDNIPYDDWGEDLLVNQTVEVDCYDCLEVFDPLSVTNNRQFWHRGYPWQLISVKNKTTYLGKKSIKVDVQAGLWDGDPDIDAVERITACPLVKFDTMQPYYSPKITVFNSQNTFLSRDVLPFYMMFPFVGRMDDIWGSYFLQKMRNVNVVFTRASVYQARNEHNLFKDMKNELIGYENNLSLIRSDSPLDESFIPQETINAFKVYGELFGKITL
jgi:hypothetical protein